jgi:hypothetical protein
VEVVVTLTLPLALLMLLAQTPKPQQAPPQTPPKPAVTTPAIAAAPAAPQGPYEFTTDMGAFVVVVKADKAASFDAAMGRLKAAIAASTDKNRKSQATGWRVLKSSEEATDGAITYLWLIDPVSKTTTYDPIAILKELAPADVQPVYDQLQASIVSITRVGLKELLKMGGS